MIFLPYLGHFMTCLYANHLQIVSTFHFQTYYLTVYTTKEFVNTCIYPYTRMAQYDMLLTHAQYA
ncbi:hypothetical protein E2C01_052730 [Portunus trituberculatus]|uniref:Uncharacterized protein n=1 Tax=Portunus trituberculatus TaxID=210409 RepID=A0A5B7GFE8_PORTR|nr:hypothetical protein [Portunus trituberculatus]